jgi:hypothetical protein
MSQKMEMSNLTKTQSQYTASMFADGSEMSQTQAMNPSTVSKKRSSRNVAFDNRMYSGKTGRTSSGCTGYVTGVLLQNTI